MYSNKNMNVQTKTEPVHTVCTPLYLSPFFLKKRLFSVFDPRCLLRVSKTTRGAFSPNMHFTVSMIFFYLKSVSYPGEDSFALFSVDLSLYACFCFQSGQMCLYSDF